ncbi:SusC/RagA family TonB-linked outer membrane protein [Hymenobacter sp. BT523]|uniref:SusC/RagA family TonB-linked outer membrane protein n=1 Tax=Hymenobacter sp. BT523 TaxID=2795725 RepID=UPI0018EBF28D|nr:SusC/RagA family TonB-linked outer membrane protein [Hymenobacter sp. BT523]MBJ6110094.1 SusC/RagA family TonB-linked outer membrane protein [Hymenobacter sp. BT523]
MKKTLLMSLVLMFTLLQGVLAQTRSISGRVTDQKSGEGLPGVTVLLKGTTTGISTNANGDFTLTVPQAGGTLVFSSVGMATQERVIGSESQFNVVMAQDTRELSEVVVTALGIERDTRSLGYATQQIKAEQISQKSEPNVLSALQGKVAGVNIVTSSGLPGASSNINIRGITSLGGSNQPLFVVDGIPISNDLDRTSNTLFGAQQSNRALDIDPENVESINILKGPAAAALYGSRASSGAIIITTKAGRNVNKKLEVTVTSGLSFQKVYGLMDLQNDYGQGTAGINTNVNGDPNTGTTASWGPRFGTTPTLYNGLLYRDPANANNLLTQDYRAYPNNTKDFYKTGRILQNGVNITGGNADQNVSLNVNNTNQRGITDYSTLNRTSVQLGGNTKLVNKLRAGGSVNFIQTTQRGPQQGNSGSPFGRLNVVPRSYDLQGLPYINAAGRPLFIGGSENPYWSLERNGTTSNLTRFINVANLSYEFTPWLTVAYRAGFDTYTDRRKQIYDIGSIRAANGQVIDQTLYRSELNGDLLITLKKDNILTEGLNASLLLGQNINQRRTQEVFAQGDNLTLPNLYNLSNATTFSNGTGEATSVRRLLGYYGQLDLSYNNYLFVTLTGRADQSSTLPKKNNTFFYPSATLGFVFTDAFKISNDIFSYGKIRGNVARVGRDANPYLLNTTYLVGGQGNNVASFTFPFSAIPNGGTGSITYPGFGINTRLGGGEVLTPEFTQSYEAGANLGFFRNRLTFDLTYFKTISKDQILNVTTAPSTGFLSRTTNVGRVDNEGFEGLMNLTAIKTSNFRWDISANFTRIRNKVREISEGVTQAAIGGNAFTGTIPSYAIDQPYGVIYGPKKPRVTDKNSPFYNQYIINPANGTFAPEIQNSIIADPNPEWQGGISNTLSYKGITASFLVDAVYGADVLSFTAGQYKGLGALKIQGENREAPRVIPGVIQTGTTADGTPTYRPNDIQIDAQTYWSAFGLQSDLNVFDATVYRLREITLGYSLPKTLLDRTPFGQATISFSGRNLFYYAPNAPFDPEVNTQGAGNIRGLELQGSPNARNYGVNVRFTL